MTETIIALISILAGIISANLTGYLIKRYSFGLTGNTLLGVFGSIFLIKSVGRFGFDPVSIMKNGSPDMLLFCINLIVSVSGGILAVILAKKLWLYTNKNK